VDVRVVTATNRDLPESIAAGSFRSDLYYRLNVFPIELPPLRARREDIPPLVQHFVERFSAKLQKKIAGVTPRALDVLMAYHWPGNIRELQNVIERAAIVCDSEYLSIDERRLTSKAVTHDAPDRRAFVSSRGTPLTDVLVNQEKAAIEAALAETGGLVSGPSGAAAMLGVPPSTLESKIRSLSIDKRRFKTVYQPRPN
jgi:formate hydrogenlyase transcriptional activator